MKQSTFTTEQLVDRWEDQRDVKNLMGIYVNYIIMNDDAKVFDDLWAQEQADVCYGDNNGWYIGPQAVRSYYRAVHDRNALVASLLQKKFPEEIGGKSADEIFGIGTFRDFPVADPVIEIAADGKTAKGLWYCWGSHAEVTPTGPHANWTWGFYAADFIREGDKWKIWHLEITNDVDARCGTDWGKAEEPLPELPEFAALKEFKMPLYSGAKVDRPYYSAQRPLTPSPKAPEPYTTFAETFSYGI